MELGRQVEDELSNSLAKRSSPHAGNWVGKGGCYQVSGQLPTQIKTQDVEVFARQ